MSTSWDIGCKTCNADSGLFDANHGEKQLSALCSMADAIIPLAEMDTAQIWNVLDIDRPVGVARFFREHKGHDVRPRDEYGRWADQCHGWCACPTCGHSDQCGLPIQHEGEHSRAKK